MVQLAEEKIGADYASLDSKRARPRMQELGLVIVILILGISLTSFGGRVTKPSGQTVNNFLRFENVAGGILTPMSTYAIMAVGVTFVVITGGIDISVGAIFALAALGAAAVLQYFPEDAPWWQTIPTGFLVASAIGLACGCLNGALVVFLRMHPFIVTLGTMSIFRGICNVAVPLKTLPSPGLSLPDSYTSHFFMHQVTLPWFHEKLMPVPMLVMAVCVIAGWIYLRLTVAGRENYAVGGNEEAARFSGLNVGRIKLRVYSLSGLACGIAGAVYAGYYGSASSNTGLGWELMVIAAAVVGGASLTGGRGTALGALLGTMVIKMIENGIFVMKYDQQYSNIIVGAAIIVAVAVDRFSEYMRQKRLAGAGVK